MDYHQPTRRSLSDRFLGTIERAPVSDRIGLRGLFFLMILLGLVLLITVSLQFSSEQGVAGGTFSEGMLGTPRFVNPVLAQTRTDQDITELLYSGLMKIDTTGELVPDLAESVTLSEDGATYTVVLRTDRTFHDNTPITAADVLFTLSLIQNGSLKSPLQGNWNGVTVSAEDERTLTITLTEPYVAFAENLTVGILPAAAWSEVPIEQIPFSLQNVHPIGSGPYKIVRTETDESGVITEYDLEAHDRGDETANINAIALFFYTNELELREAMMEETLDATAHLSAESLAFISRDDYQMLELVLPRIFAVFFNQNSSAVLRSENVRSALNASIDREALVDTTLTGYGVPITTPIVLASTTVESTVSSTTAEELLTDDDWSKTTLGTWEKEVDGGTEVLRFTLKTSNDPLFQRVSEFLAAHWRAAGADVVVEQYKQSDLVQNVIRPRAFEALLFGVTIGRTQDLYPFWHSSQQNDPGLNIAQYANLTVDNLLENARSEQDDTIRTERILEASEIITSEQPAIFLFQPASVYLVNQRISVSDITDIEKLSDRYSNIEDWHIEQERLWPFFTD